MNFVGELNDPIGLGCALEEFTDAEVVDKLLDNLKTSTKDINFETDFEKFVYLFDKYQEQPHLLDPYLERLLNTLLTIAKQPGISVKTFHQCFKYFYILTKIRNYKAILKYLPHEVADLQPTLLLISEQDSNDNDNWHTRYSLLLWLSIIVIMPFHMSRLDGDTTVKSTMKRIFEIGLLYLTVVDKSRDASAYMLSKFLTRPEIKEIYMGEFITNALKAVPEENSQTIGYLLTLCLLFKHGKRSDMLPYAKQTLATILDSNFKASNNSLLRKLSVKIIQRLGLTFLPIKVAAWRYQRGVRSLEANLTKVEDGEGAIPEAGDCGSLLKGECDEEFDVPEEIEEVIEYLLNGLRDKETIIRWSAAKGIGRVTNCLPKTLADEVVGSVLELFSFRESDSAWHGGCLALAELGRRGLLLPERLPDVLPVILRSLVYDEQRGTYSVGSHIRDAACYVCWAFARAYDPNQILPYVGQISSALLITAVFDREINCRRAASAAFQENVGRQGNFPHGIDIVTVVDFFAVANRTNAYTNLSVYVAQYSDYSVPLIDHLLNFKISHWDSDIREVAGRALHFLAPKSESYVVTSVIPKLIALSTGPELNARHGAILALAEILHSLFLLHGSKLPLLLGNASIANICSISPTLKAKNQLKGMGGDLMKHALSSLIEKYALCGLPIDIETLSSWQEIIQMSLIHVSNKLQKCSATALQSLAKNHYITDQSEQLVELYLQGIAQADFEHVRLGYALALGVLPQSFYLSRLERVMSALERCGSISESKSDEKWVDSRKAALQSLTWIAEKTDWGEGRFSLADLKVVLGSLLAGLGDVTIDASRGDIGALVREVAMVHIKTLFEVTLKKQRCDWLDAASIHQVMTNLAAQSMEKISRMRLLAAKTFLQILYLVPELPHISDREQVKALFPGDLQFSVDKDTFTHFVRLLRLPSYSYSTLLGLIVSIGDLTEGLVKSASSALFDFLRPLSAEELRPFCFVLIEVIAKNQKHSRIIQHFLKAMDLLLTSGILSSVLMLTDGDALPLEFSTALMDCAKQESKARDPNSVMASTSVVCGLLAQSGFDVIRRSSLSHIAIMLCNRYPRVRSDAADKFYEVLITCPEAVRPADQDEEQFEPGLERVIELLSDFNWVEPNLEIVRVERNKLCDLLCIPKPKLISKSAT